MPARGEVKLSEGREPSLSEGSRDRAEAKTMRQWVGCRGQPRIEALVNGGRNYNGPKVAKFLVG